MYSFCMSRSMSSTSSLHDRIWQTLIRTYDRLQERHRVPHLLCRPYTYDDRGTRRAL